MVFPSAQQNIIFAIGACTVGAIIFFSVLADCLFEGGIVYYIDDANRFVS
jgi:hypothetical protein